MTESWCTLSPICRDPLPPLYTSITPLQPLMQLVPGQGNKPALVQTCPLVWYWWLSMPSFVWTWARTFSEQWNHLILCYYNINPCTGSACYWMAARRDKIKTSTCMIQNPSRPHAGKHKRTQAHTRTHTNAFTHLLIKTDSGLAHLINP